MAMTANGFTVFNASLAVFGTLLLPAQDDAELGFASPGYREAGRDSLTKAIEALTALASENALVDRCVEHLRQLCQMVDSRSKHLSLFFRSHLVASACLEDRGCRDHKTAK